MRKRIVMQASLALLTIMLTVIIIFAMSAAWYTNIVQTSGLTFDVEAWGFEGKITADSVAIQAGPGDDGLISLTVESDSDSPSSISVSVSKTKFSPEMQKRLFFYVDTQATRNGETVDRVYLNSLESYTYTLFSQGNLILTETLHNDAQLKWHWVYDVLGYYVLGKPTADGQYMAVTDYLRPIEYDYDRATMGYVTTVNEDLTETITMEILTVDGTLTPEEYLIALSATDGYEGTITAEDKTPSGYYKVDVDEETGYGVYAYLLSYSEIQLETQYDTAMGQAAKDALEAANTESTGSGENAGDSTTESTEAPLNLPLKHEAILTVSAQKNKNNVLNVTNLQELNTALNVGAVDVIELSSNITIGANEALTIANGVDVMLDLAGHKIVSETTGIPVNVTEGGSLTMYNGSIESAESNGTYAIYACGGEVVLSDVDIVGFDTALRVADNTDNEAGANVQDSVVRLINCEMTTDSSSILMYGNGSDSQQNSLLVVEGCIITSNGGYGISGNGSTTSANNPGGNYGTDIQIINSTITSRNNGEAVYAGIYHPQKDSSLTIYNSIISGNTGVVIKGGTVRIAGSKIEGTGEKVEPGTQTSGFVDTGDAVYVETNYGYDINLEIGNFTITNPDGTVTEKTSVLTSTKGYGLQVYEPGANNVDIRLVGGVYNVICDSTPLTDYLPTGYQVTQVEGGYAVTPIPETTPAE